MALEHGVLDYLKLNHTEHDKTEDISYELRTALNSIIGYSELMLRNREVDLTDREMMYLSNISGCGRKMLYIVNDIVEFMLAQKVKE